MKKVEQYGVILDVQGKLLDDTDVLIFLRDYFSLPNEKTGSSAVANILTSCIDSLTELNDILDRLSSDILPATERQTMYSE